MNYRLLYVTTLASTCRAFLLPYAVYFRESGWQVDAMGREVSKCEDCGNVFDNLIDADWTRNPLNVFALVRSMQTVRSEIINGNYDILHVHTPIAAFIVRWVMRHRKDKGKPAIVYTAHGFHFHRNGSRFMNYVFERLEILAGRWTNVVVTINEDDYVAAKNMEIVPSDNIYYIPGIGVDLSKYKKCPDRQSLLDEFELPPSTNIILSVSEFTKNKRHKDQLRALHFLNDKNTHLLLVGEGPQSKAVYELAVKLQIESQVHFLGIRSDIPRILSSADILILTSAREGLPRCILEAFSIGIPVIGTRARGTSDLLSEDCGLLVDIGDHKGLALAVRKLLEDSMLRGQITMNASTKVKKFRVENVLQQHKNIYSSLLPNSM